jgi:hypothetical protein
MYIICEAIVVEDPKIKRVGAFWHFIVLEIEDADFDSVEQIKDINYVIVPQNIAQADRLCYALHGKELHIKADIEVKTYDDLIQHTSFGDNEYTKQIYYLTEQNDADAVEFMKIIMKLYMKNHPVPDKDVEAEQVIALIDELNNLYDAQMLAAQYFPMGWFHTDPRFATLPPKAVDYFCGYHWLE